MDKYLAIAKKIEEGFKTPEMKFQSLSYVDKDQAEIVISSSHTLGDYLVLGFVALAHSINGVDGEIKVYNNSNVNEEIIGVPQRRHAPLRKVKVKSEIYLQVADLIEQIFAELYDGDYKVFGLGLSITAGMTTQFSELEKGIPEEIMSEFKFTNFDDMITAQENALLLIKKMSAAGFAGAVYAMENGMI